MTSTAGCPKVYSQFTKTFQKGLSLYSQRKLISLSMFSCSFYPNHTEHMVSQFPWLRVGGSQS